MLFLQWCLIIILFMGILAVGMVIVFGFVSIRWVDKEYELRDMSIEIIHQWIQIRNHLDIHSYADIVIDWYEYYLKPHTNKPFRCKNIRDVWNKPEEFNEVYAFVEANWDVWEDIEKCLKS